MILGLRSKELQEGGDYFTAKYFSLFACHAACDGIVLEFRIHPVDSPSVSLCGKVGVLFYRGWFYFTFIRLTGKYTKIAAIALPVSFSIHHVHTLNL